MIQISIAFYNLFNLKLFRKPVSLLSTYFLIFWFYFFKKNSKSQTNKKSPGRLIPASVKFEVYQRDKGRCVECGETSDLHYDHILPYSKGGSSTTSENIQLLCARHNLSKSNKII